ncbi:hypothetical protein ABZR88_11905 [Mucilaginibacter yixingensis]|nr:hypothetical protein [Mucilaginibacter yixingensis]
MMNFKTTAGLLAIVMLFITACTGGLSADKLYGKWNYVKVDHPKGDATDTVNNDELEANKPYILFKKNDQLEMWWGGKLLSHGSFKTEGKNIQYTEQLPGGQSRTFPFWVSQLDSKTIVFETLDKEGSRVTANKQQ